MKQKNLFSLPTTILFIVVMSLFITAAFGAAAGIIYGSLATITALFVPAPAGVVGLNNISNSSARESFNHAKRMFFRAFRDKFPDGAAGDQRCSMFVDNLKLSQSEIRLEVQLTLAANIFTFGVTPQQASTGGAGAPFNTENRLQLQDSLCVNEYGIFVGAPASAVDTTWLLRTYGNQIDFPAGAAAALDSTFYSHGNFLIKANNDVIMPYRGLFNHWYKGETQQTAALGAASPGDQIRGAQDGMITDEPNIVLIGSKNYQPQIVLPTALAAVTAFERAIVIFRGILAQNSTVVS